MKFTVFGGGGFIGSTIVDLLLAHGYEVRVFERPRVPPYREFSGNERVEWVCGDFSSAHDVGTVIRGSDVVFHLVSTTLPKSSNDDPVYDVQSNIIPTLQMLNAMVEHKVRKIVFISSGGTVYGAPVYLPLDECHPTDPMVSYGITKLTIEKYLQMYSHLHGIRSTILRVANPYGERQRVETAQGAVGIFLYKALTGQPIEIWGDGSVTRDYIHVSDVAEAFLRAANYEGPKNCFNVSSGVGTRLDELVNMISEVVDIPIKLEYFPGRPFDIKKNVLSNALAREELGWVPRTAMKEGLVRTAKWMKSELAKVRK